MKIKSVLPTQKYIYIKHVLDLLKKIPLQLDKQMRVLQRFFMTYKDIPALPSSQVYRNIKNAR